MFQQLAHHKAREVAFIGITTLLAMRWLCGRHHARRLPLLAYLILFAVFAIPAHAAAMRPPDRAHRARFFLILASLILILAIGLRFEVGGDWFNYLIIYDSIRRGAFMDSLLRSDPGYALLNRMAAEMGWGIWFPNLICAAIFTWGLISFSRQQPNPSLALVTALYVIVLVAMGFTRQSAALGFVMLAIAQYSRGTRIRMLIYLGLGTLFHASAVFVMPLIGLAAARRGLVAAGMVILLAAVVLFQLVGHFQDQYSLYGSGAVVSSGAVPRLLMIVLPAAIYLSFRARFSTDPSQLRLWTIFAWTSFPMLVLLILGFSTIADRLAFYLTPMQIFVLSRLPYAFGAPARPSVFLVAVVAAYSLAIVIGWLSLGRWGHAWLPYDNYLWGLAQEGEWPKPRR